MVQQETTAVKTEETEPPLAVPGSPAISSQSGSVSEQVHWEDEFIEFIVAIVRLLLTAGFVAFRLGARDFGHAISSPAVGDALRNVAQELRQLVVDTSTPATVQNVPARSTSTCPSPSTTDVRDSPIAVSRGARVGVFKNSIDAAPFITGVSNSVSRACDTYEEACGAFFHAMDRGLVVAYPTSKAPVVVTSLNMTALSKEPEPLVVGIDTSLMSMAQALAAYRRLKPKKFYTVIVGLKTGVFSEWLEVGHYVLGVPGMNYRVFEEEARAEYALNEAAVGDIVRVVPDWQGQRLPIV